MLGQWRGANSLDEVFTDERFAVAADDQGQFVLEPPVEPGMLVGAWSLWARRGELIRALVFEGLDQLHHPIEIPLAEGGYVKTGTLAPDGRPLAEVGTAAVLVNPAAGFVGGYQSDENGDLQLGPLPVHVELRVQLHPDISHLALDRAWWSGERISLKPGEVYELQPLRLDPEGRMTVRAIPQRLVTVPGFGYRLVSPNGA